MTTLLTFTGFHDPYSPGLIAGSEQPGPILALLTARHFDRVVLFSTPGTIAQTTSTAEAIGRMRGVPTVETADLQLVDPTDHVEILRGLRECIRRIVEKEDTSEERYFISVSSGTPQMHACWFLLAASGEIPARILQVRPPRFVTDERPLVTEIDPRTAGFPDVRRRAGTIRTERQQVCSVEEAVAVVRIVGTHQRVREAIERAAALADSTLPILISGETGTGKELFAHLIHHLSGRPIDRFVALNCAAIPKDLVESTLFGHKKGAFTGAITDRIGIFDRAHGGTLFLDEIGEMPLESQPRLLRVLDDGMVEPVGAAKGHKVDVRVVGATNRDLRKEVRQGNFREDLFYRLNDAPIRLPPLRERKSDIPVIALQILDLANERTRHPKQITQAALLHLQHHRWPGNVRDLAGVINRSVVLAREDILDVDDLRMEEGAGNEDLLGALPDPHDGFSVESYLESARKQLFLRAIDLSNGNQTAAARLLGVSAQAVYKFAKSHLREPG